MTSFDPGARHPRKSSRVKSLSKVGQLALLLQMAYLLHQLLFSVTSQCKTLLPSVVHRPVVG